MNINPLTLKKIRRFRSIKRGYYSLLLFATMLFLAVFAELWINNRALLVYYEGEVYFPIYGAIIPGNFFKQGYAYETNYRELQKQFEQRAEGNFVILPLVPYNAFEMDLSDTEFPPLPPSFKDHHYLGTDVVGRDMVARLVYGFRICITFSLLLLVITFAIGIALGCLMGYWGGEV